MTIDEMIAVLQAAKVGKQIQFSFKHTRNWMDCISSGGPDWAFDSRNYRVKPEPREWWVWVDPDGVISQFGNHKGQGCATRIKVREVLE